jgi:hypothetical protein
LIWLRFKWRGLKWQHVHTGPSQTPLATTGRCPTCMCLATPGLGPRIPCLGSVGIRCAGLGQLTLGPARLAACSSCVGSLVDKHRSCVLFKTAVGDFALPASEAASFLDAFLNIVIAVCVPCIRRPCVHTIYALCNCPGCCSCLMEIVEWTCWW